LTILKEIDEIEATERFTSLVDIICGYRNNYGRFSYPNLLDVPQSRYILAFRR